ncbi:MAG: HPr(Ser) kinase/phosphatase [Thermodesulfobacteriota bacterium]
MPITVKELLDERSLALKADTGRVGLSKEISTPRIQKPGLLLTGLLEELHPDRVQIFGAAEIGYLTSLDQDGRALSLKILEEAEIAAIIVTRGIEAPDFLLDLTRRKQIPVLSTQLTSSILIERLIRFLEDRLAPTTTMHGVLADVLGIGTLILGKSGIGKSECALDLVSRGYRLVADDAVIVKRLSTATLFGSSSGITRYHMEVRGVGIINVKDLFGITAIRERKQMDLVVELVDWDPKGDYERLGFEDKTRDILGVDLPYFQIPVSPGRSVATIVEVAARNQVLKIMGYRPGTELEKRLRAKLHDPEKTGGSRRP